MAKNKKDEPKDMPVYLFTGFLEGGKTKFIQETLEDRRFCNGERTLLLVCEEGVEEYAPEQFAKDCVKIRVLEDPGELTKENLERFAKETRAERVVIEYNGMWMLDQLYTALPDGWMVYQEFLFVDSASFLSYNANMRNLVYDKLKSCELVVFNRFTPDMDKMAFHKIVRAASRRADIAYEDPSGNVVYDDIVDPLPFDLNAPVIEIGDEDYAEWYRDMSEEPQKYEGKTVRFKGQALVRRRLPPNTFVIGRHVMTCCVEDIQFAALVCNWDKADTVRNEAWMTLTAKINFKFSMAYGRKGPVLSYISHEYAIQPEQPVATFY